MALCTYDFESGTDGNTISGGSTAFDLVFGDNAKFSNVLPAHGALGGQFATRGTAAQAGVRWSTAHGNLALECGRAYFALSAAPTATTDFIKMYDNAGTTKVRIVVTTNRLWHLISATTVDGTTALVANTLYRVEWKYDVAATTVTANLYLGDSTTPLEPSLQRTDVAASADCGRIEFGVLTGLVNLPTSTDFFYFDDLVSGASDFPGPVSAPPTQKLIYLNQSNLRLA